jgi:23S rRNA (adenine2503-C2)-methyltransferase
MQIISKTGDPNFAEIYVARMRDDKDSLVEFVDARDPRYPKSEKWVMIVSTQIGCPVGCLMCDSGTFFHGNLTKEEIFAQIDHIIDHRPKTIDHRPKTIDHRPKTIDHGPEVGDLVKNHPKLKIQFARMGEPALNHAVLDALEELQTRYPVKGLIPCIATTAPDGSDAWFDRLAQIKDYYYGGGRFQLQFSLNSTDEAERDRFMPMKKWGLEKIARYGKDFFKKGDRKVVLNFALGKKAAFDVDLIKGHFDPSAFIIKITPINPTESAVANEIRTLLSVERPNSADILASRLDKAGFDTIISIGAREEIEIGSNCGQSVRKLFKKNN